VRSLEVYKFINDSSEHFLIFLNYKEILNKISLHDLNQIKPLIVDFFFLKKVDNIANTFIEIELYYSNDD
jgi:hypothetical protein